MFAGLDIPTDIEQYAVLTFASGKSVKTVGGAKIMLAGDLIAEILSGLRSKKLAKAAVPEQFPLVRTLQYVVEFRAVATKSLA